MAKQRLQQNNSTAPKVPTAEQCTQTEDRTTSELIEELQTAHKDLQKWTTKLQCSEEQEEEDEQEQREKVQVLKSGILNFSVKLQQEQAALLKKAARIVTCTTEEKSTRHESQAAQSKEFEKINLELQTLQQDLHKQALSLKTAVKPSKPENKYVWIRIHKNMQQQTDLLDEEDIQRMKASFAAQLHDLKKANAELTEARTKAEEQLQLQQQQCQEERRILQVTIQVLLKEQKKKMEEWTEKQMYMAANMETLESEMAEILKKKTKKRSLLSRLFRHSSAN
ncbi:hypothetical protein EXN66_Car004111 [Xyrichtys novacula]|uniref:Uncharacterized protein n=1 Tax=Xyrichtys novacula TaxID=13765 RepID=A0AAV1F1R1_XYRNO|nr:hypothetical protein EXN66_Car004111 [Xyrichtys novacula]